MFFNENKKLLMYFLGLFNSSVAMFTLNVINPSLSLQNGDMVKFPILIEKQEEVNQLVEQNIYLSRTDWDSFETSWDFQSHPFIRIDRAYAMDNGAYHVASTAHYYGEGPEVSCPVEACFLLWQKECNERFNQLKQNEEMLNRIFIDIYGLQDELTPEVADKDVTVRRADLGRDIRSLISYAVGCMMGRYVLDKPGLQFAGGDWQAFRFSQLSAENQKPLPHPPRHPPHHRRRLSPRRHRKFLRGMAQRGLRPGHA